MHYTLCGYHNDLQHFFATSNFLGNPVNCKCSDETSTQHQDHQMVIESNIDSGGTEHKPTHINEGTSHQNDSGDHMEERTTCEDYSSLKRSSSVILVEPLVYAQLHLYANINSIDNN